jgi:hypothetical protein
MRDLIGGCSDFEFSCTMVEQNRWGLAMITIENCDVFAERTAILFSKLLELQDKSDIN